MELKKYSCHTEPKKRAEGGTQWAQLLKSLTSDPKGNAAALLSL